MEPTPNVLLEIFIINNYQLVDAWTAPHQDNLNYSEVRYVFCNPEKVNPAGLRPNFVAQRDEILNSLNDLVSKALWKTMGHLNPFFVDGQQTDQKVLMFDCNSRKETMKWDDQPVLVFQGGRDHQTRQGIGPMVPLTDQAHRLKLVNDNVILETPPKPVQTQV